MTVRSFQRALRRIGSRGEERKEEAWTQGKKALADKLAFSVSKQRLEYTYVLGNVLMNTLLTGHCLGYGRGDRAGYRGRDKRFATRQFGQGSEPIGLLTLIQNEPNGLDSDTP